MKQTEDQELEIVTEPDEGTETVLPTEYGEQLFTVTPVEQSVIKKAITGDKEAFESLFMGTYRYVFAAVRKYLKNDQDAYDAIQETYTRVYKGISRLGSSESFYPWLHRIAENCAKDICVERKFTAAGDYAENASAEGGISDLSIDIADIFKKLPTDQAELLIRVYYDGMKIKEIAELQGLPVTTVRDRVHAAKKNLKELLKIRGIDKPIYGGGFFAMIATALQHAIGTELLSMAVSHEILTNILTGKRSEHKPIAYILIKRRNRAIMKVAAIILLVCVLVAGSTATAVTLLLSGTKTKTAYKPSSSQTSNRQPSSSQTSDRQPSSSQTSDGAASDSSDDTSVETLSSSLASSSEDEDIEYYIDDPHSYVENFLGNTALNASFNQGQIAQQDEWVFYANGENKNCLYKMSLNDPNKTQIKLVEEDKTITGINVIGDKVYYISGGIWQIDTDGKGKKLLEATSPDMIQVTKQSYMFEEKPSSLYLFYTVENANGSYSVRYFDLEESSPVSKTLILNGKTSINRGTKRDGNKPLNCFAIEGKIQKIYYIEDGTLYMTLIDQALLSNPIGEVPGRSKICENVREFIAYRDDLVDYVLVLTEDDKVKLINANSRMSTFVGENIAELSFISYFDGDFYAGYKENGAAESIVTLLNIETKEIRTRPFLDDLYNVGEYVFTFASKQDDYMLTMIDVITLGGFMYPRY